MASTNILPLKPDFLALAKTAAAGQRKQKLQNKKRKSAPLAAVADAPSTVLTVAQPEAHAAPLSAPAASVASPKAASKPEALPRRTSWSLVMLAYGFFLLGIAINVWNAWSAGNWADMALPAAMGVLAEGVVFFLPARAMVLPAGRRMLAFALLLFVSAFALTNSLRMASIIAADQAAARADRQTLGVQTADHALDAARAERDKACGKGQGKTIACQARQAEVTKLGSKQTQATEKVAAQAKPEATDFAGLVAWVTMGTVQPGARDFDMLWLLFRTFLPQIGGLVLMLARR
jgi:hypothetical protein